MGDQPGDCKAVLMMNIQELKQQQKDIACKIIAEEIDQLEGMKQIWELSRKIGEMYWELKNENVLRGS